MDNKKREDIIIVSIIIIILLGMAWVNTNSNNNFMNIWESITGLPLAGNATANVSVTSRAPNITNVTPSATQTITEASYINVSFSYDVSDADGAGDINNASAQGQINISSTNRYNVTCGFITNANASTNRYNCTVGLWYFDPDGSWTVNVSINDSGGNRVTLSNITFTVSATKAMTLQPTGISWTGITLGTTNSLSGNDPLVVNNTGNVNISVHRMNITGYNLHGLTTASQFIYAANFSVNDTDACEGNFLTNGTRVNINDTILTRGNLSSGGSTAQEELFFCLEAIEGPGGSLSVQTYRTVTDYAWAVEI